MAVHHDRARAVIVIYAKQMTCLCGSVTELVVGDFVCVCLPRFSHPGFFV